MASSWSRQPTSHLHGHHLRPPWPQLKRSLNTFDGCVRSVVHCRRPRGSFFYLVHFTKNSHSNGRNAAFPRDAWHGYVPWYPSTIQWIICTPARTVRPGRGVGSHAEALRIFLPLTFAASRFLRRYERAPGPDGRPTNPYVYGATNCARPLDSLASSTRSRREHVRQI